MNRVIGDVLQRLLQVVQVVQDLYTETAVLSEGESELQLWYNRGYAQQVDTVGATGDRSLVVGQALLPWGKAYRHGFNQGEKETAEVLGASRT
ncbi:MAG: hypothetical protein KZQ86_19755 [Candidatus Thiodiazotropha sp. (ex Lucinoma kastoroae)]|nr:hypothetical protein [Candidatus Thiodiazotropha sp. (ex Lucinoma kastoroae)]